MRLKGTFDFKFLLIAVQIYGAYRVFIQTVLMRMRDSNVVAIIQGLI